MEEIVRVLRTLGDGEPLVRRTLAEGIISVKTCLDPRMMINEPQRLIYEDPTAFHHTLKWMPVDLWTPSNLESMKEAVAELGKSIGVNET